MCFTVSIYSETHEVETTLGAVFEDSSLYTPYYHVTGFVHPELPVITNERPDTLQLMNWGLIPRWVKDINAANDIRSKTLNARSETVFQKPSYRDAISKRRGLLPVNGFVEWHDDGKVKIPHLVRIPTSSVFTLGCIWEQWLNTSDGELFSTFSIVTTEANQLMRYIHNSKMRMPLIVAPEHREQWLESDTKEIIQDLLRPYPDGELEARPLSREVSRVKVNVSRPELLDEAS